MRKKKHRRGRRRNPLDFAPTGVREYPTGSTVLGDLTGSITKAFNLETLQTGGIMVGGAIVNAVVRDFISNKLGLDANSPLRYLLGLSTAGLLGMGVNRVLPGRGSQAFMGAITFEVARAYNQYISGMMGGARVDVGDFLIQPQVTGAVPSPMGDYLQQPQVAAAVPAPMGGFLDPYHRVQPAQSAMPGYGDIAAIGEELGSDLNDAIG